MDTPILKIKNKKIGLRRIKENVYEPKNLKVLYEVLSDTFSPKKALNSFHENLLSKDDKNFQKIESFGFVTSFNRIEEAKILLTSLRKFHDEPILIFTDRQTKDYLERANFKNLIIEEKITPEYLKYLREKVLKNKFDLLETKFHCLSDYILVKMECLKEAMLKFNNTFFLDTDLVILSNLQENFTHSVVLSPQYSSAPESGFVYGFYNAGYLFCSNPGFSSWWTKAYLEDSVFYEQECMNRASDFFDVQTFSKAHNYGVWRFGQEISADTKSLHCHISNELREELSNKNNKNSHEKTKLKSLLFLKRNHSLTYRNVIDISYKKKKLAFFSTDETCGNYIAHYLKNLVLTNPLSLESLNKDDSLSFLNVKTSKSMFVWGGLNAWNEDVIKKYKEKGFLTFCFLKKPTNTICSDDFDFGVPKLIEEIDYVEKANHESFSEFINKYIDINHKYIPFGEEIGMKKNDFNPQ